MTRGNEHQIGYQTLMGWILKMTDVQQRIFLVREEEQGGGEWRQREPDLLNQN